MTEEIQLIITAIIAWLPAITAIIGALVAFAKMIKEFRSLGAEVKENSDVKKQVDTITESYKMAMADNYKLRQDIMNLTTLVTKIKTEVDQNEIEKN